MALPGHHRPPDDRLAAHILLEHGRGRTVAQILDDPILRLACTDGEVGHLLERADIIHAIIEDTRRAREARA